MNDKTSMGILEHIEELRRRLLYALIALSVGVIISAFVAGHILEWLVYPLPDGGLEQLEAIEITENMGVFMQASLLGGAVLAMPFMVYQLWKFVSPGLEESERRYVYTLVPSATFFFLTGVAFCYFVMLPAMISFLIGFVDIPTRLRPANYFSFIFSVMFWVGLSFEMPLVMYFLAKARLIDHKTLSNNWRVAIILISILAAVITPTPDPVNMVIVMIPLLLLYGLSIVLAWVARRPTKKEA